MFLQIISKYCVTSDEHTELRRKIIEFKLDQDSSDSFCFKIDENVGYNWRCEFDGPSKVSV